MTVLSRRSRTTRQPTGRPPLISPRDIEIFELLSRYRYLRSTFLHAFFPNSDRTGFIKRLGRLYHEQRYLDRPHRQYEYANALHLPAVYEIDDLGRQMLRNQGLTPLMADKQAGQSKNFAHALMICDILASIELGCAPPRRFVTWEEILAKAPNHNPLNPFKFPPVTVEGHTINVTSDGFFGLQYPDKSYRFFALEADRGTMPIFRSNLTLSSYHRKLLAYRHILLTESFKSHFGTPNLYILNVTTSEERKHHIMADFKRITTNGAGNSVILFKTMKGDIWKPPPADNHMIAEPWHRVGNPPFSIATP